MERGIFFFIDYGYPRSEYYHPQRTSGTLLCHYRHLAHNHMLAWPGIYDISANVDFTALANAGTQAGLGLECYSTQAHFLLAGGVLQRNRQIKVVRDRLMDNNEIKHLLMPGGMGERFQVMAFSKNLMIQQHRFTQRDLRHRL